MALVQKSFSDLITFTRSSGGGVFNAQGQYEWLPANQPRIDYDPVTGECKGLLIEEQRTNLLMYSADFTSGAWTKSNATIQTAAVAPDGTSARKITEDTTVDSHYIRSQANHPAGTYTATCFLKRAERGYAKFGVSGATQVTGMVDLYAGTISNISDNTGSASFSISILAADWYRVSVTFTISGSSVFGPTVAVENAIKTRTFFAAADDYQGDGTSGIYIWGAQLEAGAFPTSYIPTTSAQVTRAPDVASVNDLSPWFNASEGTLFVEFLRPPGAANGTFGTASGLIGFTANSLADRLILMCRADGAFEVQSRTGGAFGIATNKATSTALGAVMKAALAIKQGDYAMTVNGQAPVVNTANVASPPVTFWRIGSVDGGNRLNGHIRSIRYYPKRLSNTELQALTA